MVATEHIKIKVASNQPSMLKYSYNMIQVSITVLLSDSEDEEPYAQRNAACNFISSMSWI